MSMIRSRVGVASLFVLFASAMVASAQTAPAPVVGDSVLAYWQPNDAYFVATLVEKSDRGNFVVFEDGATATLPDSKIRRNEIKVGTVVMARWSDGKFYPGKVGRIVGRALYIHFDDGDKGWAPWAWVAVK